MREKNISAFNDKFSGNNNKRSENRGERGQRIGQYGQGRGEITHRISGRSGSSSYTNYNDIKKGGFKELGNNIIEVAK